MDKSKEALLDESVQMTEAKERLQELKLSKIEKICDMHRTLPLNEDVVVEKILHVNTINDFYILDQKHAEQWNYIDSVVGSLISFDQELYTYRTEESMAKLAAYNYEPNKWRRVKIISDCLNGSVQVLYVDHGTVGFVPLLHLKKLPKAMETIPPLAIHCSLDVFPITYEDEDPSAVQDSLNDALQNKLFGERASESAHLDSRLRATCIRRKVTRIGVCSIILLQRGAGQDWGSLLVANDWCERPSNHGVPKTSGPDGKKDPEKSNLITEKPDGKNAQQDDGGSNTKNAQASSQVSRVEIVCQNSISISEAVAGHRQPKDDSLSAVVELDVDTQNNPVTEPKDVQIISPKPIDLKDLNRLTCSEVELDRNSQDDLEVIIPEVVEQEYTKHELETFEEHPPIAASSTTSSEYPFKLKDMTSPPPFLETASQDSDFKLVMIKDCDTFVVVPYKRWRKEYTNMHDEMFLQAKRPAGLLFTEPQVNDVVIGKILPSKPNLGYFRAAILRKEPFDSFLVKDCDTGKKICLPKSNMYAMSEEIMQFPIFGYEAILDGVENNPKMILFSDLTSHGRLLMSNVLVTVTPKCFSLTLVPVVSMRRKDGKKLVVEEINQLAEWPWKTIQLRAQTITDDELCKRTGFEMISKQLPSVEYSDLPNGVQIPVFIKRAIVGTPTERPLVWFEPLTEEFQNMKDVLRNQIKAYIQTVKPSKYFPCADALALVCPPAGKPCAGEWLRAYATDIKTQDFYFIDIGWRMTGSLGSRFQFRKMPLDFGRIPKLVVDGVVDGLSSLFGKDESKGIVYQAFQEVFEKGRTVEIFIKYFNDRGACKIDCVEFRKRIKELREAKGSSSEPHPGTKKSSDKDDKDTNSSWDGSVEEVDRDQLKEEHQTDLIESKPVVGQTMPDEGDESDSSGW